MSESKYMSRIARKMGVPKKSVILEEKSEKTVENARYARELMNKKGFESAVIVTSPFHIKRARKIFEKTMPRTRLNFEASDDNISILKYFRYALAEVWSSIKLLFRNY
jgi:uncharacterized SAM-binding protein YcdF (DUF218 family)